MNIEHRTKKHTKIKMYITPFYNNISVYITLCVRTNLRKIKDVI